MIRVKVTKNIVKPGASFMNFTAGQIAAGILAIATGIATFFILKDYINFNLLMWIIFFEIIIIIGIGIIRVNDMNLFTFIFKSLKGVDKRPYSNDKGVFDDEFDIF